MSATLISIAAELGAPLVEKILAKKIGAGNAGLATQVIRAVAQRAGTTPDQVEALATEHPDVVRAAIEEVEHAAPEMVALYAAEVELAQAALAAEKGEPLFARLWRPGGMYLIGFLWFWNVVLLHVANAAWKIALPVTPWDILLGLSGLYFSLYMGGHTVKDVIGKWVATRSRT